MGRITLLMMCNAWPIIVQSAYFSRSSAVLLQHHLKGEPNLNEDERDFTPRVKTENENSLVENLKKKGSKGFRGLELKRRETQMSVEN